MDQATVDAAFDALARPGLRLIATADQEGMSAVLAAESSGIQWLVFVAHSGGANTVDQYIGESGADASQERKASSSDPDPIQNRHSAQHAGPRSGTERPTVGWHAITGIAALDAKSVRVATTTETQVVDVAEDGRFLSLLRGPWGKSPTLTVLTTHGDEVPVHP